MINTKKPTAPTGKPNPNNPGGGRVTREGSLTKPQSRQRHQNINMHKKLTDIFTVSFVRLIF